MKKKLLITLVSFAFLAGCAKSETQKIERTLLNLTQALAKCEVTSEKIQEHLVADVRQLIANFEVMDAVTKRITCHVYDVMYTNTWEIKETKLRGDSGVAIIIFDQYDMVRLLSDLQSELNTTFTDASGANEEDALLFIDQFFETKKSDYKLKTIETKTIELGRVEGVWKIRDLSQIDFTKGSVIALLQMDNSL